MKFLLSLVLLLTVSFASANVDSASFGEDVLSVIVDDYKAGIEHQDAFVLAEENLHSEFYGVERFNSKNYLFFISIADIEKYNEPNVDKNKKAIAFRYYGSETTKGLQNC